MNEEAGREIGGGLGEVLDVDTKAIASEQARFLRIRLSYLWTNLCEGELLCSVLRAIGRWWLSNMSELWDYATRVEG